MQKSHINRQPDTSLHTNHRTKAVSKDHLLEQI